MNFITHDQAYSLYPFTTLCKQETVVLCELWRGSNEEALRKYKERGWEICEMDDICERDDTSDSESDDSGWNNDDRYASVKGPSELRQEKRDSLFELKRVNNYKCTKVKLVNERIVK
jgi:hypothetical protein